MRTDKLSVNKVCMVVCAALFLLSVAMSCTIYFLTRNILALCCGLLYAVFVAGCMVCFSGLFASEIDAVFGRSVQAAGRYDVSRSGPAAVHRGRKPVL